MRRYGVVALLAGVAASLSVVAPAAAEPVPAAEALAGLPAWGSERVPQVGSGPSELTAVSALGPADVWAVGHAGTTDFDADAEPLVQRWDGKRWAVVRTPKLPGAVLYGVVAIASDDVWMVGRFNNTREALILHWDGTSTGRVAHPNPGANRNDLYAVAAVGPDDVWAVGQKTSGVSDPLTLHWNGTKWSEVDAPGTASYDQLNSVTAVAEDDVWAVGNADNQAVALHWDGSAWTEVDAHVGGDYSDFTGVSAASTDEVWAVGTHSGGDTLTSRWDGTRWRTVQSPNPGFGLARLSGVTAVAPDDIWAVGDYRNAGGPQALTLHWDGTRWSKVRTPKEPELTPDLEAASADATGQVWAVGSLNVQAYALKREPVGEKWKVSRVKQVGVSENFLAAISAAAPDDIWAVGAVDSFNNAALAMHYNGRRWTTVRTPSPPEGSQLNDVVAIGPDDVWAVGHTNPGDYGDALAMHWDGSGWTTVPVPQPGGDGFDYLVGVDGVATDDVWAVGASDTAPYTVILHWEGERWTETDIGDCTSSRSGLRGISMLSATDGWAVGDVTTCRWNGNRWKLVPSLQPRPLNFEINYQLRDVSAATPDDAWAVGSVVFDYQDYLEFGSFTEHWNGSEWKRVQNPSGTTINGVEALAPDNVWAVGQGLAGPVIVRWNGAAWNDIPVPDPEDGVELLDLTVTDGELWAPGRGRDALRAIVYRAPSPTQGAVVGTSNVGHASLVWTGPESGSLETDPSGDFQIGGLRAGRYKLTLALAGCTPASKPVDVVAGKTRGVDITLDCS